MSKEQLEEIEGKYTILPVSSKQDGFEYTEVVVEDLVFLIQNGFKQAERVQELEELKNAFDDLDSDYIDLMEQNKRYRELLESIRYTQDVAKEIQAENPNIKVITPDDLLQHMLRKVNKELESELE